VNSYQNRLKSWRDAVDRTSGLFGRMNTYTAEVAATVHFAATSLQGQHGRRPTASEGSMQSRRGRFVVAHRLSGKPFFNALVILALRCWIDIDLDKATEPFVEQVVMA
jgi:hypothetical protein